MTEDQLARLLFVVIGRDEGVRLERCLRSISEVTQRIIYVDSGSTDGSTEMASAMMVKVLSLPQPGRFSPGRARNAGVRLGLSVWPDTDLIHFVDGDCELVSGWPAPALQLFESDARISAVCGRTIELDPKSSIYAQLCEIEWDRPSGEVTAVGGIFLVRRVAFESVNGFDESLMAGEEPELCLRIRGQGGIIWRLKDAMVIHDSDMRQFSQWWRRSVRTGFGNAQSAWLISLKGLEPLGLRESIRALSWGIVLPTILVILLIIFGLPAFVVLLLYVIQWIRLVGLERRFGTKRVLYPTFLLLGKFPEAVGLVAFVSGALIRSLRFSR